MRYERHSTNSMALCVIRSSIAPCHDRESRASPEHLQTKRAKFSAPITKIYESSISSPRFAHKHSKIRSAKIIWEVKGTHTKNRRSVETCARRTSSFLTELMNFSKLSGNGNRFSTRRRQLKKTPVQPQGPRLPNDWHCLRPMLVFTGHYRYRYL
jgi:hypothetical protein